MVEERGLECLESGERFYFRDRKRMLVVHMFICDRFMYFAMCMIDDYMKHLCNLCFKVDYLGDSKSGSP